jgi:large subunit ribosomal protein L25
LVSGVYVIKFKAMTKISFKIKKRLKDENLNTIRIAGDIPANVYGLSKDSKSVKVGVSAFNKLYSERGDTGLVYLKIEDEKDETPVLIDEIQVNPVTDKFIHVAFKRVDLKEKVVAEVPIEIIGEVDVPGAVLVTVKNSLEVEALPADLPDKFELDISSLEKIGDSLLLSDIKYDSVKVEIKLGESGMEEPVVLLQEQKEEEPEVVEEEPVDGESVEGVGEAPKSDSEDKKSTEEPTDKSKEK